jgi:ABC-type uncharacterized transport system substrate-binding protein
VRILFAALHVVPALRRLAILVNIGNPGTVRETREIRRAAQTAGLELAAAEIQRADDIAPAIEALSTGGSGHAERQSGDRLDADTAFWAVHYPKQTLRPP